MDLRKLKTLIDLVSESNITELEITENEGKVRIVKGGPGAAPMQGYAPAPMGGPGSAMPPAPLAAPVVVEPPVAVGEYVKSPMVGTFYSSATPGSKPFVEIGSTVHIGEPICIIEAMKIMNEIEAEISGTIAQILVKNGQAVEFGQPLFVIE